MSLGLPASFAASRRRRECGWEDVDLIDTSLQPLLPDFREPPRRLKVVVRAADPQQAARDANAFLREFLDYRRRWYARELGDVRRYLAAQARLRPGRAGALPERPAEPGRGWRRRTSCLRLEQAGRCAPPARPRRRADRARGGARDALVAALIGGLVGWFTPVAWLPRRRRPRPDRRR